jgi:hypothetical protein
VTDTGSDPIPAQKSTHHFLAGIGSLGFDQCRSVPVPTGADRCRCRGKTARNAVLEFDEKKLKRSKRTRGQNLVWTD